MPKKYQVYNDFSGGINSKSNAKFIKNNELVEASGVLCDEYCVFILQNKKDKGVVNGL